MAPWLQLLCDQQTVEEWDAIEKITQNKLGIEKNVWRFTATTNVFC